MVVLFKTIERIFFDVEVGNLKYVRYCRWATFSIHWTRECFIRARLAHECNVPLYSRMEKWTHPLFHSSQWNDLKLRPVWLAPDLALNNVAQIPEWVFPSHPIKIIITLILLNTVHSLHYFNILRSYRAEILRLWRVLLDFFLLIFFIFCVKFGVVKLVFQGGWTYM